MKGPLPKDPSLRKRRNRASTRAVLSAETGVRHRVPFLPKHRAWHPLTRAWWRDTWHSPMSSEFLQADVHGLYRLAELVDRFWTKPSISLASEIRQEQQAYGLSPIDRRRLEWEVERLNSATRKRRPYQPPSDQGRDPREYLRDCLRVVK
ncbi:MAG: hypothetical protein ABIH46_08195 [Chloroflexota bacterium]